MKHLERQRPLKDLTTFGIGGYANYFIEVFDIPTMQEVLSFCKDRSLPFLILGKGSNVLFQDEGFAGVVIANRISFFNKLGPTLFHVGAGYSFSLLGSQTARQGLGGLEFACGIPGSVGGAVYMNAGANGSETCRSLISVDFVSSNGEFIRFFKEELTFNYRLSSFQEMQGAIVGATFSLIPSPTARQRQIEIIQYRTKTQPYQDKSAGCVFRNPSNCAHAGYLIEKSGLKGKRIGDAEVSSLHANFLINRKNATCQEMLQLISFVQEEVKRCTGFELEQEIKAIKN